VKLPYVAGVFQAADHNDPITIVLGPSVDDGGGFDKRLYGLTQQLDFLARIRAVVLKPGKLTFQLIRQQGVCAAAALD